MKIKELQFPLIKITLSFILGILFFSITKSSYSSVLLSLLLSFLGQLICYFYDLNQKKINTYFGFLTLLTSFFIGGFTWVSNNESDHPKHYTQQELNTGSNYDFKILICEKLKNTSKNERYLAKIIQINKKENFGKIIVNLRKEKKLPLLEIGSLILIEGNYYKNKKPNNPNQFDYGKYLENQQIYAQIYARTSSIKISPTISKNATYYASKLRNKIITNLEKNHFNKKELSVVIALFLGQQQDISQDVLQDYQYAGAVHVLSVSGLHVGCILFFVTFLLKPIPNTKKGSFLKLIVVLLSLWTFGLLAGLAPSVVRSVTMFSFVAIGMFLRRSVNIYNTLMVSALLILLIKPSFLFDVGFQLSYLALFFIVWLQPLLRSIWSPKNKIINYFWDIITVSFAAQIGTFPLSLYYFHQFPGLFFITNLVILPGLNIILGIGLIVIVLAAFDVVWLSLMKGLEWCIWCLNKIIAWVASFEDFIFKDIPLNTSMLVCCYLLIFGLILWFKKPNFKKLVLSMIAIIALQMVTIYARYASEKKTEFIVFNMKQTTLISERNGSKVTLYCSDSVLKNSNERLTATTYMVANFCKIKKTQPLVNTFYFKNKKILLIDKHSVFIEKTKPDILILINSPKINLERVLLSCKPVQIVADGSNFKSFVKTWKTTCKKEKIPFHDTSEKGYYKL